MNTIKKLSFIILICLCFTGCGNVLAKSKYSTDNPEGRIVITLDDYHHNSYLDREVCAFNERNPRYFVELITHEKMDQKDFYRMRETHILSEGGADLYNLCDDYQMKKYIDKGVLERLDPYIETDINKEDYVDYIFDAYRYNNATYAIPTTFYLNVIRGRKDMFPLYSQVTFEDLYKIIMENEKMENVLTLSDEDALWEFYDNLGLDIYDLEQLRKGIELLDKCRIRRENHKKSLIPPNQPLIVCLGENTPLVCNAICEVQDCLNYKAFFGSDGDYYVAVNDSYVVSGSTLGINQASNHKEGAWEFIKFVLSKERQKQIQNWKCFKVYKSLFLEDVSEECKKLEKYRNQPKEELEETFLKVFEAYMKISKGRYLCNGDYDAWLIVKEEVVKYFHGDIEIDEAIEIIIERLKQYQIK